MPNNPRNPMDNDGAFEALLSDAREAETPSEALMLRVLEDAALVQSETRAAFAEPAQLETATGGWLSAMVDALGGWVGVSGVTMAGVTGVMIGFFAPDLIDAWSGGQIMSFTGGAGSTPSIGDLWVESNDV